MTQIAQGAGTVRTPALLGPSGRLEALYTPGSAHAAYAAVVCHPHPLYGGTMHNKVVYNAAKLLQRCGMPVLRFNFRGAGGSEGTHDAGQGEQGDLLAALDWLSAETRLPLLVSGFSFGAYVSLRTSCGMRPEALPTRIKGLIALGLPIQAGDRSYTYDFLDDCTLPKLFVSGAEDAFGSVAAVEAVVRRAAPPAELVWVPGADHFFQRTLSAASASATTGLAEMQVAMHSWLTQHFPDANNPEAGAEQRQPAE